MFTLPKKDIAQHKWAHRLFRSGDWLDKPAIFHFWPGSPMERENQGFPAFVRLTGVAIFAASTPYMHSLFKILYEHFLPYAWGS